MIYAIYGYRHSRLRTAGAGARGGAEDPGVDGPGPDPAAGDAGRD